MDEWLNTPVTYGGLILFILAAFTAIWVLRGLIIGVGWIIGSILYWKDRKHKWPHSA